MKKITLKPMNGKLLSKDEMKKISGGYGCCCFYDGGTFGSYSPQPGLGCSYGTFTCATNNCGF